MKALRTETGAFTYFGSQFVFGPMAFPFMLKFDVVAKKNMI